MHTNTLLIAFASTLINVSFAQAPAPAQTRVATSAATAPATTPALTTGTNAITALCNDGSSFSGDSKKGACSGHKGVKTWTREETAKSDVTRDGAKNTTSTVNAAPGGGAGKVWVNTRSNVYHCPADRYYGKTKKGEYMSEADAKAKGAHADHGKVCT